MLSACAGAVLHTPAPLPARSGCADNQQVAGLRQAREQAPDLAMIDYVLAAALSKCGDIQGAADTLRLLAEREDGYCPSTIGDFDAEALRREPLLRQVKRMCAALPKIDSAAVFARFDDAGLIPEGMAFDNKTGRLYLGSIAQGRILMRDVQGAVTVFVEALDAVLGMTLSADGSRLYAVTTTGLRDGAVQNFGNPGRVIAIRLNAQSARVERVITLLSHHHPLLAEPTTGTIAGNRFLLLANSYVAHYQRDGTLRDAAMVEPPRILSIDLPD